MNAAMTALDRAHIRAGVARNRRRGLMSRPEEMEHEAAAIQAFAQDLLRRHPHCPAIRDAADGLDNTAHDLNGEAHALRQHEEDREPSPIGDRADRLHDDRVSDLLLGRPL